MAGNKQQYEPQNMERAFRMSQGKAPRPPRAENASPPRRQRAIMPENDYDESPLSRRRVKQRKPFRLIRLIATVIVLGWFFTMGVLVGRGTTPVHFDIDNLRSQLVTASAVISERIAQIGGGDESVDFYDSLGQTGADINISDPRNYRPEYSVAPAGTSTDELVPTIIGDGEDGAEVLTTADEVHIDGFDGKTLEPKIPPKTEFAGYLALKQAGTQVAAAQPAQQPQAQTPPQATQQPQSATANANRGNQVADNGNVPQGSFSVQVAAVRGEAEAKNFLQNLAQKGFSGRVEKTTVGEGVWYRVRVGVYQTRAQAEEELQKLIKIGIKSPMIVTN